MAFHTFLFFIIVILVITTIILHYVFDKELKEVKRKFYNLGYQDCLIKRNYVIYEKDNIIHRGTNPCDGIEIFDKEHPADERSVIPYFGINIKYNPNNEHPAKRFFQIHSECDYTTLVKQDIYVTPNGVTDGWHTFDDLYKYRAYYNAALVNMIVKEQKNIDSFINTHKIDVIKSKKHYNGEKCYNGTHFVVMIKTPYGQISNHYELKYWKLFNCRTVKKAWKWDGHTMKESIERLEKLFK